LLCVGWPAEANGARQQHTAEDFFAHALADGGMLGVPGNYQCMLCLPNFSNQHDKQGSSEAIAKLFQ
jgi:hypothetical protein